MAQSPEAIITFDVYFATQASALAAKTAVDAWAVTNAAQLESSSAIVSQVYPDWKLTIACYVINASNRAPFLLAVHEILVASNITIYIGNAREVA